jgi:hypothetical protein
MKEKYTQGPQPRPSTSEALSRCVLPGPAPTPTHLSGCSSHCPHAEPCMLGRRVSTIQTDVLCPHSCHTAFCLPPKVTHSFFFFFLAVLRLKLSSSHLLGRVSYHLSHSASPVLYWVFQDRVSRTICLWLASNHNPPDLCLLSSQDYRREPPVPGKVTHS